MTDTTTNRPGSTAVGRALSEHGNVDGMAVASRGATDRQRALLFVSLLGVSLFALNIAGVVAVPTLYLVPALVAYPLGRLLARECLPSALDALYLAALFLGLGGILAFSSVYPVGYADVQLHIAATLESIADGRIRFRPESSVNFVGLYVVATALADLSGTSVPAVARVFPFVTFLASVLVFYYGIARRFLSSRGALFATVMFGTNWGVFRFSVEYRTFGIAFVFLLAITMLFVREWLTVHLARENIVVYTLLIAALAASHLTTYVFYLAVLAVVVVAFALHHPRRNLLNYLFISLVAVFGYMTYVGGSLRAATVTIGTELLFIWNQTTGSGPEPVEGTGSSIQGFVGLTYGYNMFLAEWTLRGLFILAFVLFVLGWLRRRDRFGTVAILASGALGFGVLATSVIATFVNPSRVMAFFALPYALIYGGGLLYAFSAADRQRAGVSERENERATSVYPGGGLDRLAPVYRLLDRLDRLLTGPEARTAVRVVVTVVLLIAVTSTLLKFPAYIVGETEPIRTEQPIDDIPYLQFDGYEVTARAFVVTYHEGPVSYGYSEWTRATSSFYASVIEQPDEDIADELDRLTIVGVEYQNVEPAGPRIDRVYDNGEVVLYHGASSEDPAADAERAAD